ncbi:hypothetical protein ACTFIY_008261 [Dictyostelium cf. discoideum]
MTNISIKKPKKIQKTSSNGDFKIEMVKNKIKIIENLKDLNSYKLSDFSLKELCRIATNVGYQFKESDKKVDLYEGVKKNFWQIEKTPFKSMTDDQLDYLESRYKLIGKVRVLNCFICRLIIPNGEEKDCGLCKNCLNRCSVHDSPDNQKEKWGGSLDVHIDLLGKEWKKFPYCAISHEKIINSPGYHKTISVDGLREADDIDKQLKTIAKYYSQDGLTYNECVKKLNRQKGKCEFTQVELLYDYVKNDFASNRGFYAIYYSHHTPKSFFEKEE